EFAPTLHVLVTLSVLEFMLGLLMGWLVNLVFSGVSMGMELISTQIGMAAAKQFNPSMSTSQSALGSLAILLAIGTFLGMDLHLQMIQILGNSFHQIPPGEVGDIVRGMSFWVEYSSVIVNYSMQIGAPIMGFVFLNNFFLAMLSRLAPSMNVFFSVGFLVSMIGGMILFALMLPMLFDYIIRICEDAIREIFVLLDVIGRR
ncbi:MAG: flagellar biosynthetic protein FliR, partial [Myxococcota bacterium]|nr:flagellar biosynthetic protein FliR [Myxococcota bacterium]